MAKHQLDIEGFAVKVDKQGYVSLTDIAKQNSENKPAFTIQNWLRNQSTLKFLMTWEKVHNVNFKVGQIPYFIQSALDNRKKITPQRFIEEMNAAGITSTSGRFGGTFAHSDIALDFCRWLSPEFAVYLNQEFQRLKREEYLRLGDPFLNKRHLTAGNHSLLVASILTQVDERLLTHPQPYKSRLPFAAEIDMLNEIVFGQTAKEWRAMHPDKPTNRNQRDYAKILDLVIYQNLEVVDTMLLQWDCSQEERQRLLQETYDFQYPILKNSKTIKRM
ncbi:MAG: KilA-N domain-containing protein, partial [Saprospiraceae bacterium]